MIMTTYKTINTQKNTKS